MLTTLECANLYLNLKVHFTKPKFDIFNSPNIKISEETLKLRSDYFYFKKLSNYRYPGNIILANIVENIASKPIPWIGDIVSDYGLIVHENWDKRRQSLSYILQTEQLNQLDINFDNNFKIVNNQLPKIFKLQLHKKIIPELPSIACILLPSIVEYWNSKLGVNPILDAMIHRAVKYKPFIDVDEDKIKHIFKNHFIKNDK